MEYFYLRMAGRLIQSIQGLTNLWTNNLTMKGSDLFVSTRGGVFRSVNYGSSWTMISGGAFSISYSIEIANDSSTLFVTADPGVWKSENNGALWTQISNGITMPYGNCMSINGDTFFMVHSPASLDHMIEETLGLL
ncbi:MAG: hypothetical protein IPF81_18245 [Bacteroidetes bacterium]|nr:hypothetical protein [Bacteroidota bacterium]